MNVPQDLLFRYMERRKKDLELCLANLEELNFTRLKRLATS